MSPLNQSVWRQGAVVSVGLLGVACLALQGQRLGAAMPQAVQGEDVLSVAFGDAKETISRAMVEKANDYFHGGVEIDCGHHHGEHCDGIGCTHDHHHHDDGHDGHGEDEDDSDHEDHDGSSDRQAIDPWSWINTHIRAPEIDRHLEDEKAVEMMPWFWAAVKADPHNVEAWSTAFYIASTSMHDERLSRQVLDEARAKNPDSLELLLAEGRFVYRKGKGDIEAAQKIFMQIRDKALLRCDNKPEDLPENDRWMYKFALNYLADIEKKK